MQYDLEKHVREGSLESVPSGKNIGTDGCATCVGIIVIDSDGTQWCAHIDNALDTRSKLVETKAAAILLKLPEKAKASKVGYCTTSNDVDAAAIIRQIVDRYGDKVTSPDKKKLSSGIATKGGEIFLLAFKDSVNPLEPGPCNHMAEIK
jgi:hypothetical protein